MRLTSFVIVFALLASFSITGAHAAEKAILGSRTCAQPVPCAESSAVFTPAQWAVAGNACITSGFGYINPEGFIDEFAGLDASNCLTVKGGIHNSHLTPHCCVIKLPSNGTCLMHCDLLDK